jgi:hypothetical protein
VEGLGMENVSLLHDKFGIHRYVVCSCLECGKTISHIFLLFGVLSLFWYILPREIWQPCCVFEKKEMLDYLKIK